MTEKHVHLFLKLQSKDNLLNTNYSKDLLVLLTDIIKNYLTPVNNITFDFPYGGHSGAIILAESHLTWHSFPEDEYITFNLYSCNSEININNLIEELRNLLKASILYKNIFYI